MSERAFAQDGGLGRIFESFAGFLLVDLILMILVLKRIFSFRKVRYRGIDKNATRLIVACGLVNLFLARRVLLKPP